MWVFTVLTMYGMIPGRYGGLMVSALDSWIQALPGITALCSWARQLALTVHLSVQVYNWVLVNFLLGANLQWFSLTSSGRGGEKY